MHKYESLLNILDALALTSSRIAKEEILESIKNTDLEQPFKEAAIHTYAEKYDYGVIKFLNKNELTFHSNKKNFFSSDIWNLLQQLDQRNLSGNAAIDAIRKLHSELSSSDAIVLERILKRDFSCGITATTINKIWPDLIYIHPYQRCSSFSEKNIKNIKKGAYSQVKADGLYNDTLVNDSGVYHISRRGKVCKFQLPQDVQLQLKEQCLEHVLMGEALVLSEDGKTFLSREDGNGYLNSGNVDSNRVVLKLWNIVTKDEFKAKKSNITYEKAFEKLKTIISTINSIHVQIIDTVEVNCVDDIISHFQTCIENGEEGTVVKNKNTKWSHGTSKDIIKIKILFDVEMQIVGYKEHSKKVGQLGSFLVQSSDGIIEVSVGGGYKKDQRIIFWIERDNMIGDIMTVRANEILSSEGKKKSLFLPRHIEMRKDKTTADSYERILEQRNAVYDIIKKLETL